MRYHYEKPELYTCNYATVYTCDHPVYNSCTLYESQNKGLAVIQQRYYPESKMTYWGPIDEWLVNELYLHPKFHDYFLERATKSQNGLFPTVTVRQIMWAFRMKPLPRERWETYFDRKEI